MIRSDGALIFRFFAAFLWDQKNSKIENVNINTNTDLILEPAVHGRGRRRLLYAHESSQHNLGFSDISLPERVIFEVLRSAFVEFGLDSSILSCLQTPFGYSVLLVAFLCLLLLAIQNASGNTKCRLVQGNSVKCKVLHSQSHN